MKKICKIICFVVVLVFLFTGVAMAQSYNTIGVFIDNERVNYNDNYGYPFIDSNNRTLVPFRVTLEKAGAIVSWDNETNTAKAEKNGKTVLVKIGENFIITNDKVIQIDTSAVIKDGRTYLPIRAVLETFDYYVNWNVNTKTVEAVNKVEEYSNYFINIIDKFNKYSDDYLDYDKIIHINKSNSKPDYLDILSCFSEIESNLTGIQFSISTTGSINQISVINKDDMPLINDFAPLILPAVHVTNPNLSNDQIVEILVELYDINAMYEYGNTLYNSVDYGDFTYSFQIIMNPEGFMDDYFFSAIRKDDSRYNSYDYYKISDKFVDLFGWRTDVFDENEQKQEDVDALLAAEEFIRYHNIYNSELSDENGNLYNVYFLADDAEMISMGYDSAIWAGASLGEFVLEGNFNIACITYENSKPKIQIIDFQYNSGDKVISNNIQVNISRSKFYTTNNKESYKPDVLSIGIIQGSDITAYSSYYIKDGILTRIGTVYSTTPIVQIENSQFYTLKYVGQVSDNLWDKIILELNTDEDKFNIISTEAVVDNIEDYESYKLYKLRLEY